MIEGGEFIAYRIPRVVTMDSKEKMFNIHTLKNFTRSDGGTITVSISKDEGKYTVDPQKSSIEITIADTIDTPSTPQRRISIAVSAVEAILKDQDIIESAPTIANFPAIDLPQISVRALTQQVDEGAPVQFEIASNRELHEQLTVKYTLNPGGNFFGDLRPEVQQVHLSISQQTAQIEITTIDDTLAEQDGALTLTLIDGDFYNLSDQNFAKIIISDLVDRQQRVKDLTLANQAILPEITGAIGARTLGITTDRIEQAFSNSNGVSTFTFDGNQDLTTILTSSGEALNKNSMTLQDYLGNSSFAIGLYPENESTNLATVWGIGDIRDLNSRNNLTQSSWDGDIFTGHLGIDTMVGQNLLAGISTSVTESNLEYNGVTEDKLLFTSRTTAINPYLGWSSTNESTQLRTIIGYGIGELDIDQTHYELQTVSNSYHTLGLSGNTRIYSSDNILNSGTSELTITGQSWIARQSLLGVEGLIDSLQSNTSHYQIGIVGSHTQNLLSGSTLDPRISFLVRRDGKDQQSTVGFEFISELSFTSTLGLSLSGNSNLLLFEPGQIQQWSILGNLSYDRNNDQLGTILEISPSFGNIQELKTSPIWSDQILESVGETSHYLDGVSIKSSLGYGISIADESSLLTPFGSIDFSEISTRQYNFGTRLQIGPILKLELTGTQVTNSAKTTKQKIQFNGTINW